MWIHVTERVINTDGQFLTFYYTQDHIMLLTHFSVVEDTFLARKAKPQMGI